MSKLTPETLVTYGFKFSACKISGADMWQGMGIWYNKEKDLTLRGNCSTARPGGLKIAGHYNSCIDTEDDLKNLLSLFK